MLMVALALWAGGSLLLDGLASGTSEAWANEQFSEGWEPISAAHYASEVEKAESDQFAEQLRQVEEWIEATREYEASRAVADPAPDTPVQPVAVSTSGDVVGSFIQGYRDGGGDPSLEGHFVSIVIPCESEWRTWVINPDGPFYGLAQFLWATWESSASFSGLWDWQNPYHQGYNVAVLIGPLNADPRGQWPVAWWGC
jgi:hypothetical protein